MELEKTIPDWNAASVAANGGERAKWTLGNTYANVSIGKALHVQASMVTQRPETRASVE